MVSDEGKENAGLSGASWRNLERRFWKRIERVWVGLKEGRLEASDPFGKAFNFTVNIVLKIKNFKVMKKTTKEKCFGEHDRVAVLREYGEPTRSGREGIAHLFLSWSLGGMKSGHSGGHVSIAGLRWSGESLQGVLVGDSPNEIKGSMLNKIPVLENCESRGW